MSGAVGPKDRSKRGMQPNLRNGDRLAIIGVAVIILLFAVLMKGPELLALITQLIGDAS